jgi:FG-GAP-like repeat
VAWVDAGRIPATVGAGHFDWVVARDVDGDGRVDLAVGGRVDGGNGRRAGLWWLEAPRDPAQRRDLARWRVHPIDPDQTGGRGFVFSDLDGDGDADLLLANAGPDTPAGEEGISWYENPGPSADPPRWARHEIYRGSELQAEAQIATGDLDGDGLEDFVTQTEAHVYWFRRLAGSEPHWERVAIPKAPVARWIGRTIRLADLDGDGRLDVLGMLTHRDGELPAAKASVWWMGYRGDPRRADAWQTHVIQWGPGRTMWLRELGESWDQADVADVDGDGDLDVVADQGSWWALPGFEARPFYWKHTHPSSVSVVWLENRLGEEPRRGVEQGGVCALEAEHWTLARDGTWVERSRGSGFAGEGYEQALDALHPLVDGGLAQLGRALRGGRLSELGWDQSAGLAYRVDLTGGTYHVWLRTRVPGRWGYALGGRRSDAVWLGVDGRPAERVEDAGPPDAWSWVHAPAAIELATGRHELELRVAGRGFAVDRILLTRDARFAPSGAGPAETPPDPGGRGSVAASGR